MCISTKNEIKKKKVQKKKLKEKKSLKKQNSSRITCVSNISNY